MSLFAKLFGKKTQPAAGASRPSVLAIVEDAIPRGEHFVKGCLILILPVWFGLAGCKGDSPLKIAGHNSFREQRSCELLPIPSDNLPSESEQEFLTQIVQAVGSRDTDWIADHMIYPLAVTVSDDTRMVRTREQFIEIADRQLTDSICEEIRDVAHKPVFKNYQGVMIGDGILWFREYPHAKRNPSKYGIAAIGGFAFQPRSLNEDGTKVGLQEALDFK